MPTFNTKSHIQVGSLHYFDSFVKGTNKPIKRNAKGTITHFDRVPIKLNQNMPIDEAMFVVGGKVTNVFKIK